MRALVTGSSGFIGTNLIEALRKEGCDVVGLDISSPRDRNQHDIYRAVDLCDSPAVSAAFREFSPTHVFHLGARTDLASDRVEDYQANTEGTENLLRACALVDTVERVVATSTMLVCPLGYMPRDVYDVCPDTAYGRSKVISEERLRNAREDGRFDVVIARPTSIWGPWFATPYRRFFDMVAARRFVATRHASILRSYGYVENAVQVLIALARIGSPVSDERPIYLLDPNPVNVSEWADLVADAFEVSRPHRVPEFLLRIAARLGDVVNSANPGQFPLDSRRLHNMLTTAVYDADPIERLRLPEPIGLREGTRRTVEWMKRQVRATSRDESRGSRGQSQQEAFKVSGS